MEAVDRSLLSKVLNRYNEEEQRAFFSGLTSSSQRARDKFNNMYRQKPFEDWTDTEKENTLGYMLGYNIIFD